MFIASDIRESSLSLRTETGLWVVRLAWLLYHDGWVYCLTSRWKINPVKGCIISPLLSAYERGLYRAAPALTIRRPRFHGLLRRIWQYRSPAYYKWGGLRISCRDTKWTQTIKNLEISKFLQEHSKQILKLTKKLIFTSSNTFFSLLKFHAYLIIYTGSLPPS